MSTIEIIAANAMREIRRIAGFSGGSVGVAALHLQSGARLGLDAESRYPMASTVKMALALAVMRLVEQGALSLAELVDIEPREVTPMGAIGDPFPHDGVALSLRNLLEITITRSDNTATDVLFRLVGGPAGVMAFLQQVGLDGIEVQRTMRAALCVMHEIAPPPAELSMRAALRDLPEVQLNARSRAGGDREDFRHEQRDHATPMAMLELLRQLWAAEVIGREARDLLLDMMTRTITGDTRLRARLPQGVAVANKTGSGTGTANDLGYLTLPDGRGTLALVVYVKGSPLPVTARDAALADITRAIYDYFIFTLPN
jgi:beta-lactamase class A